MWAVMVVLGVHRSDASETESWYLNAAFRQVPWGAFVVLDSAKALQPRLSGVIQELKTAFPARNHFYTTCN